MKGGGEEKKPNGSRREEGDGELPGDDGRSGEIGAEETRTTPSSV